ncbi:ATP-binding cassette domain-containing protein [Alteribacillus sp. YIM 98480]|uniref:ATP-binding cassette domain-containing protein n=1 Tax=Alteribacillus sp. YIM 98480 TaxID=2606599 RepID=UPI001E545DAA|nr:ATP-binding cassette domain-containing protein [Alteribacillus sp. YIM 98480]
MNDNASKQSTSNLAVEAKGLVKLFGEHRAVDGVDLSIQKGTVYGFLGPNGAGKTTTIRMLSTLLPIDGGTATIFGHDLATEKKAVRSRISVTGQNASLDEDLTGIENLVMMARLMGYSRKQAKARAKELLSAFGLEEAKKRQLKKYSGGMRRRIDIAASIVVTPDLLFLDEPTTGLDPRSRSQVWNIVRTLVSEGTTVLLTTQYLDEADQLADRIGVIHQGRIIAEGTSAELKASVGSGTLHVRLVESNNRQRAIELLETKLKASVQRASDPAGFSTQLTDPGLAAETLGELAQANISVSDFSFGQPSLDEVFLTITGQPVEEETR